VSQGDDATLPDSRRSSQPASGRIAAADLGDRYEMGEVIGRGGMGEVRIARDTRIQRDVAVKLLRSTHRDDVTLGRFFREARVQGVLDHPAVVPVHDLGIDPAGNPFFVMKRLTGTTLADVLSSQEPDSATRWPRRVLLARLVDICFAIEFAHKRGVIHRDLKPANIMLGDYGEAYVIDWGLARIASDVDTAPAVSPLSGDDVGHTAAGDLLGTPGYMSPEQARGEHVDTQTDVFALGCVLYELLAGKRALPGGIQGIAASISASELRPSSVVAEVPPELDDLCARATQGDPSMRPMARQLADGIQAYLDGDRDTARRRELAASHADAAHTAMHSHGDDARSTAMREAGRALALDPANAKAQFVLGRLLLQAPDAIPAEALASADQERGETRQKAIRWAGVGFLGFLPVLCVFFALPIRHVWPIILMLILAALTGIACLMLSRKVLPMRTPWFLVIIALTASLLALLGVVFSPLLIMPIFLIGSLGGILQQPVSYPAWIIVVAHALPLVGLLVLEFLGVIPSTFHIDDGGLTFTLWAIELTPTIAVVVFGLAFVSQAIHLTSVTLIGKRAAETAQNHQHAVAWHLRQMLPRANDKMDTTGRVPKS